LEFLLFHNYFLINRFYYHEKRKILINNSIMQFFIIFKNLSAFGMPHFYIEEATVLSEEDVFF